MAICIRNGNIYYYRSVRVGDKVKTEYVGGGLLAPLAAQLDHLTRREAIAKRVDDWIEAEDDLEAEQALVGPSDRVDDLLAALLVSAGFHRRNRGPWRRK